MFKNWFHKKQPSKQVRLFAPLTGKTISLDEVPDPVFSQQLAGDGLAIIPDRGEVLSPFDGTVVHLFDTLHAIGLKNEEDVQVLIHIGIDTVRLRGEGFQSFTRVGEVVKKGDPLLQFDLEVIQQAGYSLISPVVITNRERIREQQLFVHQEVQAGKDEIMSVTLN